MDRAERRRQQKKAGKQAKKAKPGQGAGQSPESQELTISSALDLAMGHHEAGRLSEAKAIYREVLKAEPIHPVAKNLLGMIAHQNGNKEEARTLITEALATAPDYPGAHFNLGCVLMDMGKLDEAVVSYEKSLAIEPSPDVYLKLGVAHQELGRLEDAVAIYQKALALYPDFAKAHNNLGNAFKKLGRLDEAVASYHTALDIKPDYAGAHNNLGNAFQDLGALDEAVASYHKAIAIDPDYAEAHNNLGNAFSKLGDLDKAVASHKKAISIKPDSPEVQHLLNSLLGNTTDSAPREYVETVFNSYAEKFENHLVKDIGYKMPSLLKKALLDLGLVKGKLKKVIDLGCGSGLAGVEFRDLAESLIGIDLSKNMVRKAEEKNVYDELYVDDIIDRLEGLETQFDLFISADVFIYVGALHGLFQCVKKHSKKNSLFVFSTEHSDGKGFVLQSTCRYAHSKEYVLSVASESGFKLEYFEKANLRKESDDWIIGAMYILRSV